MTTTKCATNTWNQLKNDWPGFPEGCSSKNQNVSRWLFVTETVWNIQPWTFLHCSTHTLIHTHAQSLIVFLCFSVRNRLREIVGASTNWRYWTVCVKAWKHQNICAVLCHLVSAGHQSPLLLCLITNTGYCARVMLLHVLETE